MRIRFIFMKPDTEYHYNNKFLYWILLLMHPRKNRIGFFLWGRLLFDRADMP